MQRAIIGDCVAWNPEIAPQAIDTNIMGKVGQFGQGGMMPEKHGEYSDSHEYQCDGEQRIDLADDLVDRQQRGQYVIDEYDGRPERQIETVRRQLGEQAGRSGHEYGADQYHQQHREDPHELLEPASEESADRLGQAFSVVAERDHAREKIVHGSGEDTAQYDPQVGSRAELGSHDRSEYGTEARDIQELDHEDFPRRHRNVVDSVLFGVGRSRAFRIDAEDAGNEFPVDEVAGYERGQCDGEGNHRLTTITRMARCRAVR